MRPFVRSAFALACAASFATAAQAQQSTTLKMQATWPASLTLYENFTFFVRGGKDSRGQIPHDMTSCQLVANSDRSRFIRPKWCIPCQHRLARRSD